MKRFVILGFFAGLTLLNLILSFGFKKVNSVSDETSLDKTLDFSRGYDVKLDTEYLRQNIEPAHE